MLKAIGVKFPHTLKIYDFLAGEHKVSVRDFVVVETTQGLELGQVIYIDREVRGKDAEAELKEIVRLASKEDMDKSQDLDDEAKKFLPLFVEKIERYSLPMNPVGVGLSLDETKAIFYFTAEGRVDFREISRDLSRTIQKQAIMRQIGPRDEAKLIGGYGRCGRPICCGTFLAGTEGVSMEVVERQYGMTKSASKISGICGRLMCCLNYEEPATKVLKEVKKKDNEESKSVKKEGGSQE